jgi:hypothetical protein
MDKHEKQMLDADITRSDDQANVLPRMTDDEADALAFRHLRHILEYHADLTLTTDVDEGGRSYALTVCSDTQVSGDLLDLLTVDAVFLCDDHVAVCKDLDTERGCEQMFCHRNSADPLGQP